MYSVLPSEAAINLRLRVPFHHHGVGLIFGPAFASGKKMFQFYVVMGALGRRAGPKIDY